VRWTGPFCTAGRVGVWGFGSVQRMQRSCWEGIVQSAEGVQLGGRGWRRGLRTSAGVGRRGADREWVMEMRMVVGSRVRTMAREEAKGS